MGKEVKYQDKPWLAFYDKGVPPTINYDPICLPEYFENSVKKFPDRMALSFQGYEVTYSRLKDIMVMGSPRQLIDMIKICYKYFPILGLYRAF